MDRLDNSQLGFERVREIFSTPGANIGVLISGTGSNAVEILRNRFLYPELNFPAVFYDRKTSNAPNIANMFGIEHVYVPINTKGPDARLESFDLMGVELKKRGIVGLVYAGFMKIATESFVNEFPGINIHPADLTILDEENRPQYTGLNVVERAIRDQLRGGYVYGASPYIASTVHVVTSEVDCGQSISVSQKLLIYEDDLNDFHGAQDRLKVFERENLVNTIRLLSIGVVCFEDLPLRVWS